ncbi:Disks large-associated protein 3 [Labeo rohita]|uniref:Disks large-associated protein 3 n=1 Tax=Labeo rohita TaxID=84645 RepID=A0ABQ8LQ86_LABRO|nr:Disks large-associated protein 3 [Labeo rohita]
MKGYQVSRSLSQHSSGPCYCMPEDCDTARDYMHHPDHYQGHNDHPYYPPGGPPEPSAMVPSGGGTFPRSHPSQPQPYDSTCEECLSSAGHGHGHGGKMHRIPPNLLDQFEKQLPFHPDGFHTLQYQRTASGEQRSESPSRIRHLVNSVQRLFAKSHSLETPSKREFNGTRGGEYRDRDRGHRSGGEESGGHHYSGTHQSRSARRNKSRERSKSGDSRHESRSSRHRSKTAGWWSSDDNLDSDSSFLVGAGRGGRGYPTGHETLDAAIQELTLRKSKGPPPGECLACTNIAMAGDSGHSLKRSTWSAMTVSQAREVYPSSRGGGGGGGGGGGYEKALVPLDPKMKERSLHYLQASSASVPSDDWCGGGPSDSAGEIPCRRMRSGSYIKAMGDDDSADSDTSPKASPKSALIAQREAFRRSVSMDQRSSTTSKYSCKQCTDVYPNSRTTPKGHPRSRSATRSLTSAQLSDTLNLFGEMESQAVEALDLPGCFRTRSHSYVRAIQAGCSQDDDCLSVFSMSGPQGSVKGEAVFPYRKGPPPLPPRMSKPMISVTAQSSTESTQDAYFQSTGQPALVRPRQHSNSVDLTESSGGRSSRGGHYLGGGTARVRQSSNSAESLNGRALQSIAYPSGPGPMKPKHSSSADNLLEGPRGSRDRAGGSLGKSASLPQNSMSLAKALTGGEEFKQEGRGRKWRPSIAVQVDSSETLSDSDPEGKALREVHSIGVQLGVVGLFLSWVECECVTVLDEQEVQVQGSHTRKQAHTQWVYVLGTRSEVRGRARFKRSNSVTASVQADLETEGFGGLTVPTQDKGLQFGCSFQRHSSEPESAGQFAEYRTVHTQGQWAYREDYHSGYTNEPGPPELRALPRSHSPLPLAPERGVGGWSEGPRSLPDSGRASPCLRDGEFFLRLLQTEVERMEGWCQNMEREAETNELPEEVLELIRGAVGSAQMLMSQRVQQFFRMCQQSVLAIEDVRVKFQDLQRLKDSGWRLPPEKKVRVEIRSAPVTAHLYSSAKTAAGRRSARVLGPSSSLPSHKHLSKKRN